MEETFFFALLRISVAQILKAAGFDKCKPSVLNAITQLYLKHLELVVHQTKKFAVSRTNSVNDVAACDVGEALLEIGFLKPSSITDPHGLKNTKSVDAFKNWIQYSDIHATSKRLSTVPPTLLTNLIEKRKIDTSVETDQERKKRRLRERQEYFNQLKQGDDKPERARELAEDVDEDELTSADRLTWLAYLAEKDMKLGQNMKFVNTCIQDDLMHVHRLQKYHPTLPDGEDSYVSFRHQIHASNKNDHLLLSLHDEDKSSDPKPVIPADLRGVLPYNVKYDDYLLDDDLNQYLQYADTHGDEIQSRLENLEGSQAEGSQAESLTDNNLIGNKEKNTESEPVPVSSAPASPVPVSPAPVSESEDKNKNPKSPVVSAGEEDVKDPHKTVGEENDQSLETSENGLGPEKGVMKEESDSSSGSKGGEIDPSLKKEESIIEPSLQKEDAKENVAGTSE